MLGDENGTIVVVMILGKVDFSSPIERELLTLNHAKQYENPT